MRAKRTKKNLPALGISWKYHSLHFICILKTLEKGLFWVSRVVSTEMAGLTNTQYIPIVVGHQGKINQRTCTTLCGWRIHCDFQVFSRNHSTKKWNSLQQLSKMFVSKAAYVRVIMIYIPHTREESYCLKSTRSLDGMTVFLSLSLSPFRWCLNYLPKKRWVSLERLRNAITEILCKI